MLGCRRLGPTAYSRAPRPSSSLPPLREAVAHLPPRAQVFLGSEQYPYKGVLDTVAKCVSPSPSPCAARRLLMLLSRRSRSFAEGTNAWTA